MIDTTVDFVIFEIRKIKDIKKLSTNIPGWLLLYHKLLHRNNYSNRPHKRSLLSTAPVNTNIKTKKLMASNRAGWSDWQPAEDQGMAVIIEEKKSTYK